MSSLDVNTSAPEKTPSSPFIPLSAEKILSDLSISRHEAQNREGLKARDALIEMGKQHGFI